MYSRTLYEVWRANFNGFAENDEEFPPDGIRWQTNWNEGPNCYLGCLPRESAARPCLGSDVRAFHPRLIVEHRACGGGTNNPEGQNPAGPPSPSVIAESGADVIE